MLLGLAAAWRIVHSPFGRVLVGDPGQPGPGPGARATRSHRYKLIAFVLSAFLAGLGGGLFAVGHGFVVAATCCTGPPPARSC